MKILGENPQISKITYPFFNAYMVGPESIMRRQMTEDPHLEKLRLECLDETYQKAFNRLLEHIERAEEDGRMPFIKEHTYYFFDPKVVDANLTQMFNEPESHIQKPIIVGTGISNVGKENPTFLPDEFLKTISPIMLYRHPARFIPSFWRVHMKAKHDISVHDGEFSVEASLRWVRLLFDWYADHVTGRPSLRSDRGEEFGSWPILVEGDDVVHDPGTMQRLSGLVGLDPKYIQYEWEVTPPEILDTHDEPSLAFWGTLWTSQGVTKPGVRDPDIDVVEEREKLIEEFGPDIGGALAKYVELAMPDYHYLRQYRL